MSTVVEIPVGERFGRLKTVSKHVPEIMPWEDTNRTPIVIWQCECDCGEMTNIEQEKLLKISDPMCRNCSKRKKIGKRVHDKNMIGNHMEENTKDKKLTVGDKLGKLKMIHCVASEDGKNKWLAECECGFSAIYSERQLIHSARPVRKCVNCAA